MASGHKLRAVQVARIQQAVHNGSAPLPLFFVIPAKGFSGKSCSCRNLWQFVQEVPHFFFVDFLVDT